VELIKLLSGQQKEGFFSGFFCFFGNIGPIAYGFGPKTTLPKENQYQGGRGKKKRPENRPLRSFCLWVDT
jgi:hypothetical protein